MQFLITGNGTPFYTNWFDIDNHYVDGMIVYNLKNHTYLDNINDVWKDVEFDHL